MGFVVDMLRTPLTSEQREELIALKKHRDTSKRVVERIEMVLLANEGWQNTRIAEHLDRSESWVQHRIRDYVTKGIQGLVPAPRAARTPHKVTPAYLEAMEAKLAEERIWSAPQLADALAEETRIQVSPDHLRAVLRQRGYRYKRTKKSVSHSRKPEVYEAKRESLLVLKKICR